MTISKLRGISALVGGVAVLAAIGGIASRGTAQAGVRYLDQGSAWTDATRTEFYSKDQGSQLIRLAWLQALTRDDGQPFLADGLARYGYLHNPAAPSNLPVGFTVAGNASNVMVGMTCAACHTRQVNIAGAAYRIDGGPAISDFQALLTDLDRAVSRAIASDASFDAFAHAVLGPKATSTQIAGLKNDVSLWHDRQHTLFSRALPPQGWGVGRLDAVSMIFDRVSGLDIGPAADGMIPTNIQPADAPVRYPFIWDAPKQDKTQWPGFADNGDVVLGMARNLGEVYGVFADFRPRHRGGLIPYDFRTVNSANFTGLNRLEALVRLMGAPRWPEPADAAATARGSALFQQNCASCHGITPGKQRFLPLSSTWHTPLVDVGTDSRQYDVLARTASSGVLQGAPYGLGKNLQPTDKQFSILAASVIGSLGEHFLHEGLPKGSIAFGPLPGWQSGVKGVSAAKQELMATYDTDAANRAPREAAHPYEARVLHGIWATAPYLHNGSVPTLAQLLTPPDQRVRTFEVGPDYDMQNIGLAEHQSGWHEARTTTGCEDRHSGNSHCGHDYGTRLGDAEKRDLLAFMKSL